MGSEADGCNAAADTALSLAENGSGLEDQRGEDRVGDRGVGELGIR